MTEQTELDILDDDDDNAMSFREIMNMLVKDKEIILTVARDDIPQIKRNLTSLKSRDAAKLKDNGLDPGDEVLSYNELLPQADQAKDDVRLHIRLGRRKNVLIKKIERPDNEL